MIPIQFVVFSPQVTGKAASRRAGVLMVVPGFQPRSDQEADTAATISRADVPTEPVGKAAVGYTSRRPSG